MNEALSLSEGALLERMAAAAQAGDTDRLLDLQDEAGVGVFICRQTFDTEYGGQRITVNAGERIVRGHELLRGREHLFERATDLFSLGMLLTRESIPTAATRAQLVDSSSAWSGAGGRSTSSLSASTSALRVRSGYGPATC